MIKSISVKVEGIEPLSAMLKRLAVNATSQTKNLLKRHGFHIEAVAKEICSKIVYGSPPAKSGYVRTGRLLNSISTNWTGSGLSRGRVSSPAKQYDGVSAPESLSGNKFAVHIGTSVSYAVYVEFGTKYMEARPYLFPAYFMEEDQIIKSIAKMLKAEASKR